MVFSVNWWAKNENFAQTNFIVGKNALSLFAGLTTVIGILSTIELIPRLFFNINVKDSWTIGKEFLMVVLLLFTITILNYLLIIFLSKSSFYTNDLYLFLNAFLYVLIIGFTPTIMVVWVNYTIILKRNLKRVEEYNNILEKRIKEEGSGEVLHIQTNNKNEILHLDVKLFLYAKAEGNYLDVYIKRGEDIECSTYRFTVQSLLNHLEDYDHIVSTHRSYVVNLNQITSTSGNARNFKIKFDNVDGDVPVSRSRFQAFKEALNVEKE
ncbi:LytTR family DNA-binding domain-containing protein [Brumimicrobium aurantiacum]|nr:LytTR family DNA-binding domain-containing protein [Brumimicrobium aurantiacum]